MHLRSPLYALAALALVACGAEVESADEAIDQAQQPWLSGMGPTRGHEDVTRFAVEFGNTLIQDELQKPNYFPAVPEEDACFTTTNVLLTGNCLTDWPDDEMANYYGVPSGLFGTDFDLQDLHYMRNFRSDTEAVSSRYACFGARDRIIVATERGMEFWSQGDEEGALRWFGHATHNLQDSFSTCHTTRTGASHETLTDICTYKIELPGVCYHSTTDLRDRIWQPTLECTVTPAREWDCLTSEAQAAAYATAGYLLVVARHIEAGMTGDLSAELTAYFEGEPTNPHSGYYGCSSLSNDGWEPAGWDPNAVPDAGVEAGADATADAETEDSAVDAGEDAAQQEDAGRPDSAAGGSGGSPNSGGAGGSAGAEPAGGAAGSGSVYGEEEQDPGCSCRVASTKTSRSALPWLIALVAASRIRRRATPASG